MIHGIVMNQRRAPAALGAKAFGQHFYDVVELLAREISIWPGRTSEVKELIFIPILTGSSGDGLLSQHIQRLFWNYETIELAAKDTTE